MTLYPHMIGAALFDLGPWVTPVEVGAWLKERTGREFTESSVRSGLVNLRAKGLLESRMTDSRINGGKLVYAMTDQGVASFLAERRLTFRIYGCAQAADGLPIEPRVRKVELPAMKKVRPAMGEIMALKFGDLISGMAKDRPAQVPDLPVATKEELGDENKFSAYVERMRGKGWKT